MSTKYRKRILKGGFGEYLKKLIMGLGANAPELEIIEVNTAVDHVHILMTILPKYSVSETVKEIKSKTGRQMRRKFPFLDKVYWGPGGIWSIGYFIQ